MTLVNNYDQFSRILAGRGNGQCSPPVAFVADGPVAERAPPAGLCPPPGDQRTQRFPGRVTEAGRLRTEPGERNAG